MQAASGQLQQSHLLKQVRRDVARVKTLLTNKGGLTTDKIRTLQGRVVSDKWRNPLLLLSNVLWKHPIDGKSSAYDQTART